MVAAHETERSDLGALAGIIRRRAWLVILSIIVGIGVAVALSSSQQKQYQSTAVLLFRQVLLDIQLTGTPLTVPSSDATVESATNVGLLDQESVRAGAAQQLGPPYTADYLKKRIDIATEGKSNLVGIKATANSPEEAARVANTVANAYLRLASQQTVAQITGLSVPTIHRGQQELAASLATRPTARVRLIGGGRPRAEKKMLL